MKNHTLAELNKSIPYLPALRPYVGSIAASILMQQLDFWFSIKNGAPFYKFLAAQKGEKSHPAYRPGDSWCEELSISPDEFRTAFDRIGYRYKSFTEYKRAGKTGNPFQGLFYASFHDKIKGLTWYLRNHDLVDALLFEIFIRKSGKSIYVNGHTQSTQIGKVHLPKLGKPIQNITENTTQNTTENTTTNTEACVVDPLAKPDKQTLSPLLDLIPISEHCLRLTNSLTAALDAHQEDYVRSNINYCLLKHKGDEGNSLGGMIVDSLSVDYAKATRAREIKQAETKKRIDEKRNIQEEQEKLRIEAKTEEARQWCESEEGKAFTKQLFFDDS
ncbi:MAG: hypothetical protein JJE30_11265 [Desulfuromonadales bacterium]|nr:hypothetical protein [Desulfuromonadales bacterium]